MNRREGKTTVFVYGTLKRGGAMSNFLNSSKFLNESVLEHFKMYRVGNAYPVLRKVPYRSRINAERYLVSMETLDRLDYAEGEGFMYDRIWTHDIDGRPGWIYVGTKEFLRDNEKILTHIEDGDYDVR
jgi:gamma-glutamylcyclotransferase (GGCT)/AIG2-like uncharacterized protein YtfP